jgi:ribosomal protein S18 acetylase RimI-like enzyme
MIDFHQAGASSLDEMVSLIDACRLDLIAQGLYQWDENYPSRTFYQEAIQKGHAFLLRQDEILAGLVVLDERQHPSWRKVRWEPMGSRPLVIHSLAIHPGFQGQRLGSALLEACEDWARSNRFDSIRLDVFAENLAAVNLYRRHGYRLQGVMTIASKPAGHQQYDCYQKSL